MQFRHHYSCFNKYYKIIYDGYHAPTTCSNSQRTGLTWLATPSTSVQFHRRDCFQREGAFTVVAFSHVAVSVNRLQGRGELLCSSVPILGWLMDSIAVLFAVTSEKKLLNTQEDDERDDPTAANVAAQKHFRQSQLMLKI
ncbi:hypothetical protein PIB30_004792 [Stylosanthes scabra]|uniref:Uncharacterized protein n=1 Tax=Stylosanthes scabra TaxID=79078 RepID=A0ABU6T3M6_9FABA|nr:hypothetical protein [Stylosanthes scabra]